jgi:hypothetical protein
MKVYVCWTSAKNMAGHEHPCGVAVDAVREAGHDPEIVKAYGWVKLPGIFNNTAGRRRAEQLTGSNQVPVLELDDGTAVAGSQEIVAWAKSHPAGAATTA